MDIIITIPTCKCQPAPWTIVYHLLCKLRIACPSPHQICKILANVSYLLQHIELKIHLGVDSQLALEDKGINQSTMVTSCSCIFLRVRISKKNLMSCYIVTRILIGLKNHILSELQILQDSNIYGISLEHSIRIWTILYWSLLYIYVCISRQSPYDIESGNHQPTLLLYSSLKQ